MTTNMRSSEIFFIYLIVLDIEHSSFAADTSDVEKIDPTDFFHELSLQDPLVYAGSKVIVDVKQYIAGLNNEDIHLNVSQLIRKYGYKAEEHDVKTEDGYLLTLVRIPNKGPAVFLMHGLLLSADDWVIAGPDSAIAYSLANEGYDVWMGNARGNKHSRRHEVLSPSSPEFWDFSWDEIGRYDLPAMIDYVLKTSNQTQLFYVGHSQGCTSFFVMCSELPEYNDKISLMVGLAPAAAIPNLQSPILNLLKYATLFQPDLLFTVMKEIGYHEFLPSNKLTNIFRSYVCGTSALGGIVCNNIVFLLCGFDVAQQNVTNLPVIFSHMPSGAATKQIGHYAQTVTSGKFRRYDYGRITNLFTYGSNEPPEYPLEKITAPTALFYSDNDWLVSVKDVEVLYERLPNVIDYYKVPLETFNHVDYLYARDLKELVVTELLSLLKQYK